MFFFCILNINVNNIVIFDHPAKTVTFVLTAEQRIFLDFGLILINLRLNRILNSCREVLLLKRGNINWVKRGGFQI